MIKHMILWKLNEELSVQEKEKVKRDIKEHLEALVGKVPGLIRLSVVINAMESSNADLMLDSVLESAGALAGYQAHPEHVKAADTYVRPFTDIRLCMDYEIPET